MSSTSASQTSILQDITSSLEKQTRNATFALGGSIPNPPVTIRFGNEPHHGSHVTFLTNPHDIQHLIQACRPATFGRGQESVLDNSYCKAGALDTTAFATTFCPYRAGITDVLQRMLLPSGSVRAELYKLNVYSAPSGKFKAHVDTPRGGGLVVRHGRKDLTFNWGTHLQLGNLSWAAFYSACEHEVLEVTAGHRITLTYNLFRNSATQSPKVLNAARLPLYKSLGKALDSPSFLPLGRVLAIYLTHAYAHTSSRQKFSPRQLKGADMAIYETASALGLPCFFRPVTFIDQVYSCTDCDSDCADDCEQHGEFETDYTVLGNKFRAFAAKDQMCEGEELVELLRGFSGEYKGEEWAEGKVTWLNEQQEALKEAQLGLIAYGNDSETGLSYSYALMLIRIPPWEERGKVVEVPIGAPIFGGVANQPSEKRLRRRMG